MSSVCLKIIDRNKIPLRITTRYTQQTSSFQNLYKELVFPTNSDAINYQLQNGYSPLIFLPYIPSIIYKTIVSYVVLINEKDVNKRGLYT